MYVYYLEYIVISYNHNRNCPRLFSRLRSLTFVDNFRLFLNKIPFPWKMMDNDMHCYFVTTFFHQM